MKKIAVLQSNYIPWKGYFDLISYVDEFILYDEVQYTRRDWRNRNKIKTPHDLKWLTVPVKVKGKYNQSIRETELDGQAWRESHWRSFASNYAKAPYFKEVSKLLEPVLLMGDQVFLSDLNRDLLELICAYLGISTPFRSSNEFKLQEGKSERLLAICLQAGAQIYVSGPAARDYLNEELFRNAGISVEWFDYSGYPQYPQLWGAFEHGVTILDLLFNCGPESVSMMRYVHR
jgi:hypothetical protein